MEGRERVFTGRQVNGQALLAGAGAAILATLGCGSTGTRVMVPTEQYRPGQRARQEGAVEYKGADWVVASAANYRMADRPYDFTIDRVVLHVTQSTYPVALKVFRDHGHRAAAHYVVRARDGHIAQMVGERDVVYHAGNRAWNERSKGIEHEGFVDQPDRWFTDTAYRASARLGADICARYDIPVDRDHIVGHYEVPGTDHTDPGPHWDWDRYLRLVRDAG
ncbi:N-acetylmuramoyl-L-alanine amidase [Streptomyces sp. AS02]|uniref:N-acetylmuramoyl-L-alanine amidase n=1 Tax=Streptomyces sp. AS02 TaxID=2938946 RepID=UPI0020228D8C|nr:N-acetylmuramoyl-L-alanine amidase [Streptomyces sp. AS02]MCL8011306.1 N-acetylmuramoyl-L-alanine amidase [Streptomyces sp. AS02]